MTGNVAARAVHHSTSSTRAQGDAEATPGGQGGGTFAAAGAIALNAGLDDASASIARDIDALTGDVTVSADSTIDGRAEAVAGVGGAQGGTENVDDQIERQLAALGTGLTLPSEVTEALDEAESTYGINLAEIGGAAAIGVNVARSGTAASIADGTTVNAGGVLTIGASVTADAEAVADADVVMTASAISTGAALNFANLTSSASIGSGASVTAGTVTVEAEALTGAKGKSSPRVRTPAPVM